MSTLDTIKIVLVRTYHPGNIGSAARAMKTMGMKKLYLVNPVDFPSSESVKMARGASDVVTHASVVDSVYEAIKDCQVVVASTARERGYALPFLNPEQTAQKLNSYACCGKVALLFGPERMGLSNEDLQYATHRVAIPTSPDYLSLNIAAAVQTLCYEIFKDFQLANHKHNGQQQNNNELPDIEALEGFYSHLQHTLTATGFIFKKHPGEIMKRLRALFVKAELNQTEISILRGVLSSVQKYKQQD